MGVNSKNIKDPLLQTHYEVLGLSQNCSFKEVRDSFLAICKKVHPDVNQNDPKGHQPFLKLNEAYSVLSNPAKRQLYDARLMQQQHLSNNGSYSSSSWVENPAPFGRTNGWRDETIWSMRDKSKDKFYENKPYYGIKGLKKFPNSYIVGGCMLFMLIGATFHYFIITNASRRAITVLDEMDKKNMNWYAETRKRALASDNTRKNTVDRLSKEWDLSDNKTRLTFAAKFQSFETREGHAI